MKSGPGGASPSPIRIPVFRSTIADGAGVLFAQNGSISREPGGTVPIAYLTSDPSGSARGNIFWAGFGRRARPAVDRPRLHALSILRTPRRPARRALVTAVQQWARRGLRRTLGLLAMTVMLPLALLALGLWQTSRGADDEQALVVRQVRLGQIVALLESRAATGQQMMELQFRRGGQLFAGPLAVTEAREALGGLEKCGHTLTLAPVAAPGDGAVRGLGGNGFGPGAGRRDAAWPGRARLSRPTDLGVRPGPAGPADGDGGAGLVDGDGRGRLHCLRSAGDPRGRGLLLRQHPVADLRNGGCGRFALEYEPRRAGAAPDVCRLYPGQAAAAGPGSPAGGRTWALDHGGCAGGAAGRAATGQRRGGVDRWVLRQLRRQDAAPRWHPAGWPHALCSIAVSAAAAGRRGGGDHRA